MICDNCKQVRRLCTCTQCGCDTCVQQNCKCQLKSTQLLAALQRARSVTPGLGDLIDHAIKAGHITPGSAESSEYHRNKPLGPPAA